jgi:hypothetical protein
MGEGKAAVVAAGTCGIGLAAAFYSRADSSGNRPQNTLYQAVTSFTALNGGT